MWLGCKGYEINAVQVESPTKVMKYISLYIELAYKGDDIHKLNYAWAGKGDDFHKEIEV